MSSSHLPSPEAVAPSESLPLGPPGLLETPAALILILAVNVVAYVVGVIGWYGPPLNDAATPLWAWPFVPDCPLFGLLGGLALLQVVAFRRWTPAAQRQTRRILVVLGAGALLLGGLAFGRWFSVDAGAARSHAAMWLLAGLSLLLAATLPGRPLWFAAVGGVLVAGQVKYGVWTLTLWGLYWRNTALLYGAPLISFEGVLMVVAHIALIAQGLVLLAWMPETLRLTEVGRRPSAPARVWGVAALAVLAWFALSDYIDYARGYHPAVHQLVSLETIRISTERMTWAATFVFLLLALQASVRSQRAQRAAESA